MLRKLTVALVLLTISAVPLALAQGTIPPDEAAPQEVDPDYLRKLALYEQYGPFCVPAVGPDMPPPPCAYPGDSSAGTFPGDSGVVRRR